MASNAPLSSLTPSLPDVNLDDFVHLEDRYKCPVCKGVLRNPCQTPCGHRLCEICVDGLFSQGSQAVCPGNEEDCDVLTRDSIYPDQSCRRELLRLMIKCPNRNAGCSSKVPWKSLQSHIEECPFRTEECPNKGGGCHMRLTKEQMKKHVTSECNYRLVKCNLCSQEIVFCNVEKHNAEECPESKVKCPYNCGASQMKRRELMDHRERCPKKPEQCKFKHMGCTFEGSPEAMAKHEEEDVNKHLELITVRTAEIELTNARLQSSLQNITRERDDLAAALGNQHRENELLKASIAKQEHDLRELKLKMVSHLERIIRMEQNLTGLPNVQQMEELRQNVDQLKQAVQTLQTRPATALVAATGGNAGTGDAITRYGDLNTMADALTTQLSAHDRQIGIHDVRLAEMDLRFQILETASYDGTLLWKIRDYQRRKQDAVNGRTLSLYSQPFYTGRYGYKMCARVYLNGDGMGKTTHVSLFFVIMKGEYDSLLPWPFQQKVTLYLLDQGSEKRHLSDHFFPDASSTSFRKPTTEMNIASGCPLFVSHSVLENVTSSYLKDDTIFIKVVVDTANLRHP